MDIPDLKVESNFDSQCRDGRNLQRGSVQQFCNTNAQVTHFKAPKVPNLVHCKDLGHLNPLFENFSKPNALFGCSNIACTQFGCSSLQKTQFGYSSVPKTQFGFSSILNKRFETLNNPNTQFGCLNSPNAQFGCLNTPNAQFGCSSSPNARFGYQGSSDAQFGCSGSSNAQFGCSGSSNAQFGYQGSSDAQFGCSGSSNAQCETLNTPSLVFGNSRTSNQQYSNSTLTGAQFGISGMHDQTFLNDYNDQLTRSRFPVANSHNFNSNYGNPNCTGVENNYCDFTSTFSDTSYVNKGFRNEDSAPWIWRVENSLLQTPAVKTISSDSAVESRNLKSRCFNALNLVNGIYQSPYALELNNSFIVPENSIKLESPSNAFSVSYTSADSQFSYTGDMQSRRVGLEDAQPRLVCTADSHFRHVNATDVRLSQSNVDEIPYKQLSRTDTRIRQNNTCNSKFSRNNSTDVQLEDVTLTAMQNKELNISDAYLRHINDKDTEYEYIDTAGDHLSNPNTLFRKIETEETREICTTNTLINLFNFDNEVKCENLEQTSSVQTLSMQHALPKVIEVGDSHLVDMNSISSKVETTDYHIVTVQHSNLNREVKVFDNITGTVFNKEYLICSKCNFSCMIESQMLEHVESHKPHSCNVCFLSFDTKSALLSHHLGDLENKNSLFNASVDSKCDTTFIDVQPQSVGGDSVRLEIEEMEDEPLTRMDVKPELKIEVNLLRTLGDEKPSMLNDKIAHLENDVMIPMEEDKLPMMESSEILTMKDGQVQRLISETLPRIDGEELLNVHEKKSKTDGCQIPKFKDDKIFKIENGSVKNVVHNSSSIMKKEDDDIEIEEEDLDHLISIDTDSSEFNMDRSANQDVNEFDELDTDEKEECFEENKSRYLPNSIRYEDGSYKCCLCYFTTPYERSYNIHLKNAHPDFKRLKCNVCSYRCRHWQNLKIHLAKHTGERNYKCDKCTFKSANAYCLQRHKIVHGGKKSFSCNQCSYSTARKDNFVKHKSLHLIKPTHNCPKCPYKVMRKQDFDRHLLSHYKVLTNEEKQKLEFHFPSTYECHICLFPCKSARNLQRHLYVHSGIKPYSCKICSFKTARKDNFKTHLKIHSPAKPYQCETCSFKTRSKHSLLRHSTTHEMNSPNKSPLQIFKCKHCRYEAHQEDLLRKHNEICNIDTNVISEIEIPKNTSNEIYFVCCRCSYRTQYKEIMNIHIKRHDKFINIEDDGTLLLRVQDKNISFKKEVKRITNSEKEQKEHIF